MADELVREGDRDPRGDARPRARTRQGGEPARFHQGVRGTGDPLLLRLGLGARGDLPRHAQHADDRHAGRARARPGDPVAREGRDQQRGHQGRAARGPDARGRLLRHPGGGRRLPQRLRPCWPSWGWSERPGRGPGPGRLPGRVRRPRQHGPPDGRQPRCGRLPAGRQGQRRRRAAAVHRRARRGARHLAAVVRRGSGRGDDAARRQRRARGRPRLGRRDRRRAQAGGGRARHELVGPGRHQGARRRTSRRPASG